MQSSRMWISTAVALGVFITLLGCLQAAATRTQVIQLAAGWNAIWLEVTPADDRVAAVFDPEKVDVVARYFTPESQVRFIEDPDEQPWNAPGWGVWYAPSRAEAFLTSLHAIQGNCSYLIHAKSSHALSINGAVRYRPLRWNTDSFNLVGLPVSESVKPTFARFFAGASGRVGAQVYRLVEGSWQKVTNPETAEIRAGEAYWIYCEGKTTYQGPLDLRLTGADSITLGSGSNLAIIEFANRTRNAFTIDASIESEGNLPLFRSIPDLQNLTSKSVRLSSDTPLGNLPAGGVSQLRLEFRPALLSGPAGSAWISFTTSDGIILRVPVRVTTP